MTENVRLWKIFGKALRMSVNAMRARTTRLLTENIIKTNKMRNESLSEPRDDREPKGCGNRLPLMTNRARQCDEQGKSLYEKRGTERKSFEIM